MLSKENVANKLGKTFRLTSLPRITARVPEVELENDEDVEDDVNVLVEIIRTIIINSLGTSCFCMKCPVNIYFAIINCEMALCVIFAR